MKLRLIVAMLLSLSACAALTPDKPKIAEAKPTLRLTLLPQDAIAPGKETAILAKLNTIETRSIVTDDDLETVHTQKIHLLIVDPTLTDYQHIHPKATKIPGVYSFTFTPKLPGSYRAWADVTPKATGKQEFAMADLGLHHAEPIDKTESHEATAGGYHFMLSFRLTPVAENDVMCTIRVTDRLGNPVDMLQPVMGSYAHMVGFYDDYRTILHTHPISAIGSEPSSDTDRGGPDLMFHLLPTKPGFVKLFVQVRINNRELTVPFGVMIAKEVPPN